MNKINKNIVKIRKKRYNMSNQKKKMLINIQ